jgi:fermentation-respiration switch protein FrsA (DUF1100 family)
MIGLLEPSSIVTRLMPAVLQICSPTSRLPVKLIFRTRGSAQIAPPIGPPVGVLGWEFLPAVTCPVTIVAGDQDRFCPLERCLRLFERTGGRVAVHTLPGADHFLAGREDEVARLCLDALTPAPR